MFYRTKVISYLFKFVCLQLFQMFTQLVLIEVPVIARHKSKMNHLISIAIPTVITTMDPLKTTQAHTRYVLPLIYENLVRVNEDQELKPSIAKSWEVNQNDNTILFSLKNNRFFSDGTNVTAYDVASSLKDLCSVKSAARSELNGIISCISEENNLYSSPRIDVISDYRIIIHSKVHPTILLYQLASLRTVIFKKSNNGSIGSGPYTLESLTTDRLHLATNKYYKEKVTNEGILIFFKSSISESILESQNFDVLLLYLKEDFPADFQKYYNVYSDLPCISQTLIFNSQRFPFNETILRLAFAREIQKNIPKIPEKNDKKD